jgi:isocitrate dehydrogenase
MKHGDFYHGEKSMTLDRDRKVDGTRGRRRPERRAQARGQADDGDVIDSMFMSKKALCDFYEEQIEDAYKTGVMFSLHVKATMMKVSHPIVFGHAVKIFYKDAFAKHGALFDELGVNVNNGWSICTRRSRSCPPRSATRSSKTCTPATSTGRNWRWWTRPRASPTSTRRPTSSSTPRCPR